MTKAIRSTVTLLAVSISVSGCISSTNYASVQEAMRGSPELVAKMTAECTAKYSGSFKDREYLAAMMRVPNNDDLPKIACTRAYKGIAAGRISYDDFQSMFTGQIKPVVIRVLQNR